MEGRWNGDQHKLTHAGYEDFHLTKLKEKKVGAKKRTCSARHNRLSSSKDEAKEERSKNFNALEDHVQKC